MVFEGIYFVMTGHFSLDVFIMSLAVVMFTIGLMYTHTVLDFEGDMCSHKKTLVCRLGDKKKAINGVFIVYGLGYLFTLILAHSMHNYDILATFVLIPLVFNLRLLKARNLMVFYSIILTLAIK